MNVPAAPLHEPDNLWVVPAAMLGTHMTDIDGAWQSIREQFGAKRVHSYTTSSLRRFPSAKVNAADPHGQPDMGVFDTAGVLNIHPSIAYAHNSLHCIHDYFLQLSAPYKGQAE